MLKKSRIFFFSYINNFLKNLSLLKFCYDFVIKIISYLHYIVKNLPGAKSIHKIAMRLRSGFIDKISINKIYSYSFLPLIIFIIFIYFFSYSSLFIDICFWSRWHFLPDNTNIHQNLYNNFGISLAWIYEFMFFYGKINAEIIPFDMSYINSINIQDFMIASIKASTVTILIKAFSAEMFMALSIILLFIWFLFVNKEVEFVFQKLKYYSILILILTFFLTWFNPYIIGHSIYFFENWFAIDIYTNFIKVLLLIFGIMTIVSLTFNTNLKTPWPILIFLMGLFILFIGIIIQHLFILGLILEMISFITVILLTYRNSKSEPNRFYFTYYYLIINGILAIPLWLGILYIYTCTTDLTYIGISANIMALFPILSLNSELIISIGTSWIILTFLFKLASAPLATWVGDIYETAATPIANFIMCTLKFGIFGIFMKFYGILILPFKTSSIDIIIGVIILASFIFTLLAVRELTIKKILAFTSVNQTGYLFMGILGNNLDTISSTLTFMIVYFVTLNLIFICWSQTSLSTAEKWSLSFYKIYTTNPIISIIIIFLFFSFAGIPPFAGFYTKYNILVSVYFSTISYSYIFVLSALISSLILLIVYLQMIISVITPVLEITPQFFPAIKSWNFWNNFPTLITLIIWVGNCFIIFFDLILSMNNSLIGFYTDLINIVYFCPNSHFINEYTNEILYFYPEIDWFSNHKADIEMNTLVYQYGPFPENRVLDDHIQYYIILGDSIEKSQILESTKYLIFSESANTENYGKFYIIDLYYWESSENLTEL